MGHWFIRCCVIGSLGQSVIGSLGQLLVSSLLRSSGGTQDSADHWFARKLGHWVIALAATDAPQMIDLAFLQPGRFDGVAHVAPPNVNERWSIFASAHLQNEGQW